MKRSTVGIALLVLGCGLLSAQGPSPSPVGIERDWGVVPEQRAEEPAKPGWRIPLPPDPSRPLPEMAIPIAPNRTVEVVGAEGESGSGLSVAETVTLADGTVLTTADVIQVGDVIESGFVRNTTNGPVLLADSETGEIFELPPWELGALGSAADAGGGGAAGCSVSCGSGYYACCGPTGCPCRPNGIPGTDCVAGGPGATSCSYTPRS